MDDDLTWAELMEYARQRAKADPDFPQSTVFACTPDGAFHPIASILESEDDEIMEDGTPYLVLAELPE